MQASLSRPHFLGLKGLIQILKDTFGPTRPEALVDNVFTCFCAVDNLFDMFLEILVAREINEVEVVIKTSHIVNAQFHVE